MPASLGELVSATVRSKAELAPMNGGLVALGRALQYASFPGVPDLDVLVAGLVALPSRAMTRSPRLSRAPGMCALAID